MDGDQNTPSTNNPVGKPDDRSVGQVVPFLLQLPSEGIVQLKFILESYEGIGVARTVDKTNGTVAVFATEDTAPQVERVLNELSREIPITRLDPATHCPQYDPEFIWLLGEFDGAGEG